MRVWQVMPDAYDELMAVVAGARERTRRVGEALEVE
jgi:hypothetical protein